MAVYEECRHYIRRSASALEKIEQCRIDANEVDPFACPENCLFFEKRAISDAGWRIERPRD